MNHRLGEYETINHDGEMVTVHQLLAIRNGAPPEKLFGGHGGAGRSLEAHHRTNCKLCNIPEYIKALPVDEHRKLHQRGEIEYDANGIPVLTEQNTQASD